MGNVDGLSGLISVGGGLYIRMNTVLADCDGLETVLGAPGGPPNDDVAGSIVVENNTSGCNSVEEILGSGTAPAAPDGPPGAAAPVPTFPLYVLLALTGFLGLFGVFRLRR